MPFLIISVLIQALFVLHIVKTGRNTTWIWIVVMLPVAGSIAYVIVELLPDLLGSRNGRKAGRALQDVINPNKDINKATRDYTISDNIENRMKLANELLEKDKYDEAADLYKQCLTGMYQKDAYMMFGLAQAQYGLGDYSQVESTLNDLIGYNPDFKNADAHLLYAKTQVKLGKIDLAIEEFEALHEHYPGPEATYRYAVLLKENGQSDKANELFESILTTADVSGRHYKSMYKEWIKKAKQAYQA